MRRDAVIFDIDGTLWDASEASAEGWNTGLEELGVDRRISAAELRGVQGNPYEICVELLLPGLGSVYPSLFQTLNECEMSALESGGGEFYDGALEGVKGLSRDFKIFLVSNCQDWYMDLFLSFSNIREFLAGFDCHGASGLLKGQMLRRIVDDHHLIDPVYIGDTAGDETAAKLAGVEFIYVSWGFGRPLKDSKCVGTFLELVDYLRSTQSD